MKTIKSKLIKVGSWSYLLIQETDAQELLKLFKKRVIAYINQSKIHAAIQRNDQIGYHFMVGKASIKKLKINYEEIVKIQIEKDTSEYQAVYSEVLAEFLETDEDAKFAFEKLTVGKKRTIIYHISKAKRMETKINRALKVNENLKNGETDLKKIFK